MEPNVPLELDPTGRTPPTGPWFSAFVFDPVLGAVVQAVYRVPDGQTARQAGGVLSGDDWAAQLFNGPGALPDFAAQFYPDERRLAYLGRPCWPGDRVGVDATGPGNSRLGYGSLGYKSVPNGSPPGTPSRRATGCGHTHLDIQRLQGPTTPRYPIIQPTWEDGADACDRIGRLESHARMTFDRPPDKRQVDGDVIELDPPAAGTEPARFVHTLWAGRAKLRGGAGRVTLPYDRSGGLPGHPLTPGWLENLVQVVEKFETRTSVRTCLDPKELQKFYPDGVWVRVSKLSGDDVWVTVYATVGWVVGWAEVGPADLGRTVYKLGGASGLTAGRVDGYGAAMTALAYPGGHSADHEGLVVVRDRNERFAGPGDSGGPVFFREKYAITLLGTVLGGVPVLNGKQREIRTLVQTVSAFRDRLGIEPARVASVPDRLTRLGRPWVATAE